MMNLPFAIPDWLPWWVPILLLIPALMWALAFLLMPFSVIGLKSRLDALDQRLDEIQGEMRALVHRLPEPIRQTSYDDIYTPPGTAPPRRDDPPMISRPPIPPAAYELEDEDPRGAGMRAPRRQPEPSRPARTEPRFDRPR